MSRGRDNTDRLPGESAAEWIERRIGDRQNEVECWRQHIWYKGAADLANKLRLLADHIEANPGMVEVPPWLEDYTKNWGGDEP